MRKIRTRIPGLLTLLLALLLGFSATPGLARQDTVPASPTGEAGDQSTIPSFEIYPKETGPGTYFDVMQDAATEKHYTVVLANTGPEKQGNFTGRVFAVDVRMRTNGGLDTGGPTDEKTGVTTWLDFPNDVLTLEPGSGIERTFTVTVPKDTPPGEYITALCFETADPLPIVGAENFKQNLRKTIAFNLTVPGEIHPEFSIQNVHMVIGESWSGLQADLVNSGNVLVQPEGRLTISTPDGKPLMTSEIGFGSFYAGHTGLIQYGLGDLLPGGEYDVTIELSDPETGATAIVENQRITTTTQAALDAATAPPVSFLDATGELKPNAESPQFLLVDATLENTGDAVEDAELSLQAKKDGKLVENYVLVSPLSLPQGETSVSNRYLPMDGWSAGTWSFTLSVQINDRQTGVSTVLSSTSLGDPIEIP